jgi:uroporphyrinogen decarboxylase
VPKDISWGFTPAVLRTFQERTGCEDPNEYFDIDVRFVGLQVPPKREPEREEARRATFAPYLPELAEGSSVDEWGVGYAPGSFYHFTRLVKPMEELDSVADLQAYPFPTFDEPWRRAHARQQIKAFHARELAVGGAMAQTIFEVAWAMRGMERLFIDFVSNPAFATYLLDRITDIRCDMARFFAKEDVDVLILGDDVSMQTGMLMSPDTWRRWFKARMARIIAEAREVKPDLHVFYHSDGNPELIIPDLIEIGITILNPIQPECIDPVMVKERYGDRLALWGTIGIQTTLPFGTPDEVRQKVKTRIETVGYDGGLVLGPTHTIEPEVPWENIVALYEAIEEYGVYD